MSEVKVGDLDPLVVPDDDPGNPEDWCMETMPGRAMGCTRFADHPLPHVACGPDDRALAVWS